MEIRRTFMNKYFTLVLSLVVHVSVPLVSAHAAYDGPEPIEFTILMGGDTVGFDRVEFEDHGDTLEVIREIKITVTFLMFNAYEYTHYDREVWKDGALQSLVAKTNDNGETFRVQAQKTDQGLHVMTGDSSYVTSPEIIPTSYWNRQLINQKQLLDTQHGRILEVNTREVGTEKFKYGSRMVSTRKYRVKGELELEIWYDQSDRWIRLAFEKNDYEFIYRYNPNPI